MDSRDLTRKQMILFLRDRPTFTAASLDGKRLGDMSTDELRRLVDAATMLDALEQSRAVSEGSVLPVRCEVCDAVMHPDALLLNPQAAVEDIDWTEWTCLRCCETGSYEWKPEDLAVFRRRVKELRAQVRRAVHRDA